MKYFITLIMLISCVSLIAADEAKEKNSEVKEAYLGVYAVDLSAALKSHLKVDSGLIVESVVKKSPAALAGIKKYDIIMAVNEEVIKAGKTLSEVIHKYKPQDSVKLEILRSGEKKMLPVKLGEALPQMTVGDIKKKILINPDELKDDNPAIDDLNVFPGTDMAQIRKRMEELHKMKIHSIDEDLQRMLERIAKGPQGPNSFQFSGSSSSVVQINDGTHKITVKVQDGKKHIKATDSSGKIIFDGPINSDEDLEKLPADVRKKVDNIQAMGMKVELH